MLRSVCRPFEWVSTVPTADLYLTNGDRVRVRDGASVLYTDGAHLSLAGSRLAKERIMSAVTNIIFRAPGAGGGKK